MVYYYEKLTKEDLIECLTEVYRNPINYKPIPTSKESKEKLDKLIEKEISEIMKPVHLSEKDDESQEIIIKNNE